MRNDDRLITFKETVYYDPNNGARGRSYMADILGYDAYADAERRRFVLKIIAAVAFVIVMLSLLRGTIEVTFLPNVDSGVDCELFVDEYGLARYAVLSHGNLSDKYNNGTGRAAFSCPLIALPFRIAQIESDSRVAKVSLRATMPRGDGTSVVTTSVK